MNVELRHKTENCGRKERRGSTVGSSKDGEGRNDDLSVRANLATELAILTGTPKKRDVAIFCDWTPSLAKLQSDRGTSRSRTTNISFRPIRLHPPA